jgi:hypothetical protein
MKLNVKALTMAGAVLVGGMIFLVGLANQIFPSYAEACLELVDSIYPGYSYRGGFGSVIVGALYGLLDGAIGGALIGWLYNMFVAKA